MEKKTFVISKLSSSYIAIVLAVDVVLPLIMIWVDHLAWARTIWLIGICVAVIIVTNYLLVIRPIMNIESVMYGMRGEEHGSPQLKRLERGTGLERAFYKMYQEQRRIVEREYYSEILRQEAQLMALQSQMNPHFLFNTLESIRGYAVLHKITEVADMTEALAKMSRRMTASSDTMVPLRQEIQLVQNYMTIQRFRFRDKFTLNISIDEESLTEASVLNLLLQPIVENAVVHGVKGKRGQYEINISAYKTEKRLVIRVQDNGCGIAKEKLAQINQKLNRDKASEEERGNENHIGIALPNINQRIKLYLGEEYGLNIMSTQGVGTTVEVVLPLMHREESGYET